MGEDKGPCRGARRPVTSSMRCRAPSRNCRLTTASTSMPGMAAWSAPDAPSITESPMPRTPGAGAGRPVPEPGRRPRRRARRDMTAATLLPSRPAASPALPAHMIPLVSTTARPPAKHLDVPSNAARAIVRGHEARRAQGDRVRGGRPAGGPLIDVATRSTSTRAGLRGALRARPPDRRSLEDERARRRARRLRPADTAFAARAGTDGPSRRRAVRVRRAARHRPRLRAQHHRRRRPRARPGRRRAGRGARAAASSILGTPAEEGGGGKVAHGRARRLRRRRRRDDGAPGRRRPARDGRHRHPAARRSTTTGEAAHAAAAPAGRAATRSTPRCSAT